MYTSWYRRLLTAMLALVLASSLTACTGTPQRRGGDQPDADRGGPGIGGTSSPNLPGGATGMNVGSPTGRTELGQEISSYVANLVRSGGTTSAGVTVAPRTTVGVSTLIVGNTAYVGLDPSSVGLAPGGTSRGATTGGTTGATSLATVTSLIQARIQAAFPQVGDVYTTTDPTLVSRIASIAADVRTGTSTSGRLPDIVAIAQAMTPASSEARRAEPHPARAPPP